MTVAFGTYDMLAGGQLANHPIWGLLHGEPGRWALIKELVVPSKNELHLNEVIGRHGRQRHLEPPSRVLDRAEIKLVSQGAWHALATLRSRAQEFSILGPQRYGIRSQLPGERIEALP